MSQVFSRVDPSEPHIVSRLAFTATVDDDDTLDAELVVRSDLQHAGGGPLVGPLGSFCDTVGGVVAAMSTHPVAVATSDLGLAIDPSARPRAVRTRPRVVRSGRTTVVTEMELCDADSGRVVGWSTMTSAVLADGPPQIYDPRVVTRMMHAEYTPTGDLYAEMGLVRGPHLGADGAPGARLELVPWIGNSMGMMHGGCTIMVAEAAALAAAEVELGADAPLAVVDTHVRYLNGARVGPLVATARPIGVDAAGVTVRIEQHDRGRDRLTALATARVVRTA